MKIADRIHIVGSGRMGFGLTDDYDCHVYLLDGGDEHALIDAGGGRDPDAIVRLIAADGLDPRRVRTCFLTHAHADHAAGADGLRQRLGLRVLASPEAAGWVSRGDGRAASLEAAQRAGGYPAGFAYPACPVEPVDDGAVVAVGDLQIEALATPGHRRGAPVLRPAPRRADVGLLRRRVLLRRAHPAAGHLGLLGAGTRSAPSSAWRRCRSTACSPAT